MVPKSKLTSTEVSQYVLIGTVIGVCAPIFTRNIYYLTKKKCKPRHIRILKTCMSFFMALKSALFIVLKVPYGVSCEAISRSANVFYHISMVCGDAVLLDRIQAVLPFYWKSRIRILHLSILAARLIAGIVDATLIQIDFDEVNGSCIYQDMHIAGIVYTTLDTVVDFYATCAICVVLIRHMRKLDQDGLVTANTHRYLSMCIYNGTRTLLLTIGNLIAVVGIGMKLDDTYFIPLVSTLWPVTNLMFIALIGYDTDFTEVIRNMHSRLVEGKPTSPSDLPLPPLDDLSTSDSPDTIARPYRY
ncbi:unnamed protein product [Absidia cylindrospora]